MIGFKSRSLFYVTCSPREEFNSRLILCGYALRRVTNNVIVLNFHGDRFGQTVKSLIIGFDTNSSPGV